LTQRIVLHIDFDYFYAQCEEIRNPDLKTKPVSVCMFSDRGGDSGAIATANYTAREFGVKSGIPIQFAKKKLKDRTDSVFLPADFEFYSDMSEKSMEIIKEFADVFEYVGRDEAYLDISEKSEGDFNRASHIAQQVKNAIREKTKITCSIGISSNKLLAKIASDYKKPDGLTIVPPDNVSEFMETIEIRDIPGIGKKTQEKFEEQGVQTISKIKEMNVFDLIQMFGRKTGTYIFNAVRGIDDEPVTLRSPIVQISKISTLKKDSNNYNFLEESLTELCNQLHAVILRENKMFKSVGIQLTQTNLSNKTKSKMLRNPTINLDELKKISKQLLQEALNDETVLFRRLGVKVSELSELEGQSNITSYF
jgi:DNA polymerase IV (DinB-like DNA polymerase)